MTSGLLERAPSRSLRSKRQIVEKTGGAKTTLSQFRRRRALSATELGRLAKVATSTITAIEAGVTPRYGTIRKITDALGVRPEDILWPGDPLGLLEDTEQA